MERAPHVQTQSSTAPNLSKSPFVATRQRGGDLAGWVEETSTTNLWAKNPTVFVRNNS